MNKICTIERYNNELKGVVVSNNVSYVIPNTIKGEKVTIDIINNATNARLLRIEEPSTLRVKPLCSIYYQCGGCSLQHIKYEEQLLIKQRYVNELYSEAFKKNYEVLPTIGMTYPAHYRNKNQFVFKNVKGKIVCGLYEEGTHNVINCEHCYIQDETCDKIIETIKELMVKQRLSAYDEDKKTGLIRHVLIKTSKTTKEVMVVIVVGNDMFPGRNNFVKALVARCKEITTIIQNTNNKSTNAVLGDKETVLYGKGFIIDILLGLKFKISSKSFYQINPEQTVKLYKSAIELANLSLNDVLLDAYCGVGTIGMYASTFVNKVIGVELVKDAVNDAIMNAKHNEIKNISFFCDDASRFMQNASRQKQKIDVVIMDPPRKGSDKIFLDSLIKLLPKKIIYVSCNPLTQVEDIKKLIEKYDIKKIQPVDMFPHTSHVECIVCLERR